MNTVSSPDDRATAITGLGLITPLGDGLACVFDALRAGRSAVQPAAALGGVGLAPLPDFDSTRYATIRGMRMYNRTTRMGICAAKLALSDAGLEGPALRGEDLGLVAASTYGHLDTLIEYDRSLMTAGLQRTNGALMPLAIPSAPGALIALSFGAKAFSFSVADGAAGSLDALALGARWVAAGRARACLVVGAFALCDELTLAAARAGMLAAPDDLRVFHRRACGTALGESAAAVVLESAGEARARHAPVHAVLRSHASAFAPAASQSEQALGRACRSALQGAALSPSDVRIVSAGAGGIASADRAEALALRGVLEGAAATVPVVAVKGQLGETVDAGGLLQALVAIEALRRGVAPAIVGLDEPEVPGLAYASGGEVVARGDALVTCVSQGGACSALVVAVSDGR